MQNDDKQRQLENFQRKYEEARNRGRIYEKKMKGFENFAKDLQAQQMGYQSENQSMASVLENNKKIIKQKDGEIERQKKKIQRQEMAIEGLHQQIEQLK